MTNEELLIKNLLVELGVEDASPEVQEEVVTTFTETLLKKMLARVFELLSPEQQNEFVALREAGDEEKLNDFLQENIADLEKIMAEVRESALEEFRSITEELTKQA